MTWAWILAALLGGAAAWKAGLFGSSAGSTGTPTTPIQPVSKPQTVTTTTPTPAPVTPAPANPTPPSQTPVPSPVTTPTPAPAPEPPSMPPVQAVGAPVYYQMQANNALAPGVQRLETLDGVWELNYRTDGVLAMYGPNGIIWTAGALPAGQQAGQALMQGDGNFVLYAKVGGAYWSTGTVGHPGAYAEVESNGTWTVRDVTGTVLWASGPVPTGPPQPTPGANLPAPPTRDQLCRVKASFNGLTMVTTGQLGTVPSWGPDLWMLQSASDRATTLAAHKASGATHIVVAIAINYQEGGVVYPNNIAASNNFLNDLPTLCARLAEIILAGLIPVLMLDGDDGFSQVTNNAATVAAALKGYSGGDLTRYVVLCPGFDSVEQWELGPSGPHDNGQQIDNLLLAMRAAYGPNAVIAIESIPGFPFWNTPGSPGWSSVDVFLQELEGVTVGNAPTPTIVSGSWDSGHNDYSPNYSVPGGQETPWTQIWLDYKRMLPNYKAPPDQPFNKVVPVTGSATNPNFSGTAPVSSDTIGGNGAYVSAGTPRGRQYVCAFEYGTYGRTHGQISVQQVQNTYNYLAPIGYDAVSI